MSYLSLSYFCFLLIIFILFYSLPERCNYWVLLVGSIFYLFTIDTFFQVLVFFLLIIIAYFGGILLEKERGGVLRKLTIFILIVLSIFPLAIERFFPFGEVEWVPVGLSFWSLQIIAYFLDINKGRCHANRDFAKLTLFFAFFPQIVQGPIPRYEKLYPQLIKKRTYESANTFTGIQNIIYGIFLKLMIADKAKIFVDKVFSDYTSFHGGGIWIAAILYSIELYTDFMGCVQISIGSAQLFGISLINNFNRPYSSTTIKDFWRRWHISLSEWLRDYVYIPLGGNKRGNQRKWRNVFCVFLISALWHGSGLTFIIWGLMHAVFEMIEEQFKLPRKSFISSLCTFLLVTVAWVMFRAETVNQGFIIIQEMFNMEQFMNIENLNILSMGLSAKQWIVLIISLFLLFIMDNMNIKERLFDWLLKQNSVLRVLFYVLVMTAILIFGSYGYGFSAEEFIYAGF